MTYLYWSPSTDEDKELAQLETSVLLGQKVDGLICMSESLVDTTNAAFLKLCGRLLCQKKTFLDLLKEVEHQDFDFDEFKIVLHKSRFQKREVEDRLEAIVAIADAIKDGFPNISNPKITLDILCDGEYWYFLERLSKSDASWRSHIHKPHNFSSSLSARYCRALVNIALPRGGVLLDPCCGYGNLLVESSYLGIRSIGNDWNKLHFDCTKNNLEHFQLDGEVYCQDALSLEVGKVDAVVVDYPYNINSLTPIGFYKNLAQYYFDKTKVFVSLTIEPFEDILEEMGYQIKGVAVPHKGAFKRYVTLCCTT